MRTRLRYWLCLSGWTQRYTVVIVCVCDSVVLFSPQLLQSKYWNLQYIHNAYFLYVFNWLYFKTKASFFSYGMICSPRHLLPAIQSPARNKSPTTGCLSTWQVNLHNKSGGDLSEIKKTRPPKLHSLSCHQAQHTTDHMQLKAWPNLAPIHATCRLCCNLRSILCVHKQLPGCTVANT